MSSCHLVVSERVRITYASVSSSLSGDAGAVAHASSCPHPRPYHRRVAWCGCCHARFVVIVVYPPLSLSLLRRVVWVRLHTRRHSAVVGSAPDELLSSSTAQDMEVAQVAHDASNEREGMEVMGCGVRRAVGLVNNAGAWSGVGGDPSCSSTV